MSETTHVRIHESHKEWLEDEFPEGSMPSKLGRLIERYKTEKAHE